MATVERTPETSSMPWAKPYAVTIKVSPVPLKSFYKRPPIQPLQAPLGAELERQITATMGAAGMVDRAHDFSTALLFAAREMIPGLRVADPRQEYTRAEVEALERGGADLSAGMETVNHAVARTATKHAYLDSTSHTVAHVARMMGRTDSRIRQLCGKRQLYGFKAQGEWRLPEFQFDSGRPIPGIEHVFPSLARNLSLIAVYNWFTRPDPDLADEDSPPMSPRDWLLTGHSAERVAALAAEL